MIIQPTTDPNLDFTLGAELDDEFFSSDPGAYFRSRVVTLLKTTSPRSTPSALETALACLLEPGCVSVQVMSKIATRNYRSRSTPSRCVTM